MEQIKSRCDIISIILIKLYFLCFFFALADRILWCNVFLSPYSSGETNKHHVLLSISDEDSTVWFVGKSNSRTFPATDFCYPIGGSFRSYRSAGALSPTYWDSARFPNSTCRHPAWAEELHRNSVARTARVRARLSPTRPCRTPDRATSTSSPSSAYESDNRFILTLPFNDDTLEDIKEWVWWYFFKDLLERNLFFKGLLVSNIP